MFLTMIASFFVLTSSLPPTTASQSTTARMEATRTSAWTEHVSHDLRRMEYLFQPLAREVGVWSAPNRAQELRSRVSREGLEVFPRETNADSAGARWKLVSRTSSFGRLDDHQELGQPALSASGNRVELDHGELREWFENDERGIEQGYAIDMPPSGSGPVRIGIEFSGELSLRIDEGARAGALVDACGATQMRYRDLAVFDATGRSLDARLAPSPWGVGIEIDDARAVYPLTVDPLLTGPAWTAEGNQTGASFGSTVASAGDVNGDGFSDVIIGAPNYDNGQTDEGCAFVFLGSSSGLAASAAWSAESDQASADFGGSVATAGDVNGDGYSDVIVGAQWYDNGQTDEGRAFVYLGSSSGLATIAAWTAESDQADALLGICVAVAGDVNGDGYSDVIVGANQYDNGQSNEGRAFVFLGSSAGLATSAAWTAESNQVDAEFGRSVAPAGDVDGDGYSDVIVGAPQYDNGQTNEGGAFVYLGSGAGLSASAAWTAESNQVEALSGSSVATAGDVNADGYSDVIVGAPSYDNGQTNEGRVFVYMGFSSGLSPVAAWTAESDQAGAAVGSSVATAGDVNGDSYSDVIVGAPGYDNGESDEGRALVYLGSSIGLETSAAWTAESNQASAVFGQSVGTAGDVDGDGYSDLIVGTPSYDNGQTDEGRAFVYLGSGAGLASSAAWTAESNQTGALFGFCVATAGDVNGDGYSDVIVGSHTYDNGQLEEGRAFVYLGSSTGLATSPAWTAESNQASAGFGICVATAGDVNGDGYSDVIIGAIGYDNGQPDEGCAFVYLGSSAGLATSAAWTGESNVTGPRFGESVATAGDVNADGYSDVIVGADNYANGQNSEGRAYLYLGSRAGLATSAAWTVESNQIMAFLGRSVATAGDVNGDGYSDVIVGAFSYDNDQAGEGRAFVYLGSSSGLATSAAWTAESNQDSTWFGYSVATAGDVNGDGYSDVIVGAPFYDNDQSGEGRAFVYLGSSSGLATSAAWTAESDQVDSQFGRSVATAGDVNGDGYSDVIVGAYGFDNDQLSEGRAFAYPGSSSGLATSATWTGFGFSVAAAGDVNGDGFSDVIVGAYLYDNGQVDEGRAFLYLGNEGRGGWALAPQQRRANDTVPIDVLGRSRDKYAFRLRLGFERQLAGFAWASALTPTARMQWEVKPLRVSLDGSGRESGGAQTITGSLLSFDDLVELASPVSVSLPIGIVNRVAAGTCCWRVRVRTNNPVFPVTPWVTMPWNNVTETKLHVGPLPVAHSSR